MGKEQDSGSEVHKFALFYTPLVSRIFTLSPLINLILNLRPLTFGLTPFGWLRSITLTANYSVISYWNIVSILSLFALTPVPIIHHSLIYAHSLSV